jgi:hypothetical protein
VLVLELRSHVREPDESKGEAGELGIRLFIP